MPCWNKSEFNSASVGNNAGCFPLLLPRHKTPGIRFRSSHLLSQQTANTWYIFMILFEAYYGCRQNFLKLWGLGERQWITTGKTPLLFFSNYVIIFDFFAPKTTFLFIIWSVKTKGATKKWCPKFWVWIKSEGAARDPTQEEAERDLLSFPLSHGHQSLPPPAAAPSPHCPQDRAEGAGGSHSRCNFV